MHFCNKPYDFQSNPDRQKARHEDQHLQRTRKQKKIEETMGNEWGREIFYLRRSKETRVVERLLLQKRLLHKSLLLLLLQPVILHFPASCVWFSGWIFQENGFGWRLGFKGSPNTMTLSEQRPQRKPEDSTQNPFVTIYKRN